MQCAHCIKNRCHSAVTFSECGAVYEFCHNPTMDMESHKIGVQQCLGRLCALGTNLVGHTGREETDYGPIPLHLPHVGVCLYIPHTTYMNTNPCSRRMACSDGQTFRLLPTPSMLVEAEYQNNRVPRGGCRRGCCSGPPISTEIRQRVTQRNQGEEDVCLGAPTPGERVEEV